MSGETSTSNVSARPRLFGREVTRIHCVGVGGMGVGPLAIYLARRGYTVTGEDDALGDEMRKLLGREGVSIGQVQQDCDLVAYSSAIVPTHPAYVAATRQKIPLVRRGELLAEVTRDQKLVAVCGSHGKTTTTAMLITALRQAGFPAGYVLGGLFADDSTPAEAGANGWVVAEIDESDGTIERFSPEITVAVNLDWDHPDRYRRLEDIEEAFAALFTRTRGAVLVCQTCEMSARVVALAKQTGAGSDARPFLSFGRTGDFSGQIASASGNEMVLTLGGRFTFAETRVRARGEFNASNATAALAASQLMGARLSATSLAEYPAVRRRQAILHSQDITVIEDYAHHPAEISALLRSLRGRVSGAGRVIAIFQPHRFSRTAQFKTEFAAALVLADSVHLLDVYAAGEAPMAGGTTRDVDEEARRASSSVAVRYHASDASLYAALSAEVRSGDLVAFVGAGDIDKKARAWLETARARCFKAGDWDEFFAAVKPRLSGESKFVREEPLATKTTMRVGGAARVYAEPANLEDLQGVLKAAQARGVPVHVLGRGSNLIIPDEGVDGLVVSLAHAAWSGFEVRRDGRVWAGAGLRLKNLCGLAAKAGLVGFEFLEGIPASVGGALRMNAGAMGGWIFDIVEEVQLITLDGEVRTLAKAEMHVDYRHCAELHGAIGLGALLRPAGRGDAYEIKRQMEAFARKRHESQPREPSAGCIFKNPPGDSAGRLIDQCGLKGERVGDAEVSPVHANFIVNQGKATSADVLELVRRVRARVKQVKGVDLHPEVILYGKSWEEVL